MLFTHVLLEPSFLNSNAHYILLIILTQNIENKYTQKNTRILETLLKGPDTTG